MTDASDTDRRAIEVTYEFAAPPEKVWRAISESDLLARWLMRNDFKPIVGHRFTFRTDPMPAADFDGVIRCEVIAVDPPFRLAYTWKGGPIDTVVTWTLTPTLAGGTKLLLVHSGFGPQDDMAFHGMSNGWRGKVATSIARVMAAMA